MRKFKFLLMVILMMTSIQSFAQRIIDSNWSLAIEAKNDFTMRYGLTNFSASFGMGVFLSDQDTIFTFNVKIKNTCRVPTNSDHGLKIKLKRSSCDHRSFEDRVVRGRREDYGD